MSSNNSYFSQAPGVHSGWTPVTSGLPTCGDGRLFIGINTVGFVGVFNDIVDMGRSVWCMYETAEDSVEILTDLSMWTVLRLPYPTPSAYVYAAGIIASDMPGTVVRKLDAAFYDAVAFHCATPALPATEDSSAGDLAAAPASRLTMEQAEAIAFCSTNEPTALLRHWFRKGYAAAAQAEVQAEPVATVKSWTSGSYHRNYQLEWHKDVPEGAQLFAAPQAQPADALDAREVVGDLAYALYLLVGSDPMHSLCQQEPMDVLGRVKGTWSAAAEANARATLKTHEVTLAAMAAAQEGGKAANGKGGAA